MTQQTRLPHPNLRAGAGGRGVNTCVGPRETQVRPKGSPPPHHADLPLGVSQGRQGDGGDGADRKGIVGVEHAFLPFVWYGQQSRVETRPEHPQEKGAWGPERVSGQNQNSCSRA